MNRRLVFDREGRVRLWPALARYATLAATLLGLNYLVLRGLVSLGLPLLPAKLATEATLLLASYALQARVVFRDARTRAHSKPLEVP